MDFLDTQFDLKTALENDAEGFALRRMQDQLDTVTEASRRSMNAGLPAQEYAAAESLIGACEAASIILNAQWSITNSR